MLKNAKFDFIVSDINMPNMTGFDLLAAIKKDESAGGGGKKHQKAWFKENPPLAAGKGRAATPRLPGRGQAAQDEGGPPRGRDPHHQVVAADLQEADLTGPLGRIVLGQPPLDFDGLDGDRQRLRAAAHPVEADS